MERDATSCFRSCTICVQSLKHEDKHEDEDDLVGRL